MSLPQFRENCTTYNNTSVYGCTNEEPDILAKLLGCRRFKKAGAILSGGEVLFSVILPRCREVVAVDHSYGSLTAAYLKAILLETLGAKKLKDLLFEAAAYRDIQPAVSEAAKLLPAELVPHCKLDVNYGSLSTDFSSIRKEWFYLSNKALEQARRRLGDVVVIHGDITDIAAQGPFGLLYTSNATEHTGRDKKFIALSTYAPLVKPGGLLLCTAYAISKADPKEWTLVKQIRGMRTSWIHYLYQRVKK